MKSAELNENIEDYSGTSKGFSMALKALLGSLAGVLIFFVPFSTSSDKSKIPLIIAIDFIKKMIGDNINYLTLGVIILLCVTWVLSKVSQNDFLKKYHAKDNNIIGFLFILAGIFTFMLTFKLGPEWFLHKDVGGLALYLGGSVFLTVSIAGILVLLLTEFGFLEFVGTLLEPLMRPVYRLPGRSAVDAVASFVAAPAVGIFITNKIYKNGYYTQRESASIATNFSVCSLGFFALLTSIGGIMEYLPHMIISSFIISFIIAAIVTRIPPLSRKKDVYFDGRPQTEDERTPIPYDGKIFNRAFDAAVAKASTTRLDMLYKSFWDAITFAQKIVAYVISIATVSLVVATYTPLFDYLGAPFAPILSLLQLPNAVEIAPALLVSIAEIALPVIIISGGEVAAMSVFFICTLSTVQIIFFTESANAMLEADIPLSLMDLIVIFVIRTIVAIPLVAVATHIIF